MLIGGEGARSLPPLHYIKVLDQIKLLPGPGHGGIYPLIDVGLLALGERAGNIEEHMVPLAALHLVASECEAPHRTQGIEVGVAPHGLLEHLRVLPQPPLPHPDVEVDEELLLLGRGEVGLVGIQDIGNQQLRELPARELLVEGDLQEGESHALFLGLHIVHHHHVAVHQAAQAIVLGDQEELPPLECGGGEAECRAYDVGEGIALPVGGAYQRGVPIAMLGHPLDVAVQELGLAVEQMHMAVPSHGELGPCPWLGMLVEGAQLVGRDDNVVVLGLALDLGEGDLYGRELEALTEVIYRQGRGIRLVHGWQLALVAYKHILAHRVMMEQVGEQAACAEDGLVGISVNIVGDHGCLVHDIACGLLGAVDHIEAKLQEQLPLAVLTLLLALLHDALDVLVEVGIGVDAAVYRTGRLAHRVMQHLGRASCGGKQLVAVLPARQCLQHLLDDGGLARTGIALEDKHLAGAIEKLGKAGHRTLLVVRELECCRLVTHNHGIAQSGTLPRDGHLPRP